MGYLYLALAIIAEVIATSALKSSEQFSKVGPSIVVIAGYCAAFFFLSIVIKTIPVGVAYAIWAGLGIVLITLVGALFFQQVPDLPAMIGMAFIVTGVVVINVFSKVIPD